MKSDEPMKELSADENSISRHISYLYGRTQKELELYAAGIGVATDILTRAVGTLLLGSQNGPLLGTNDSMPGVRDVAPTRSNLRPQKMALAELPHGRSHRSRAGRPKKANGALELESYGRKLKIRCKVCGKMSDRRGFHSHIRKHLNEQAARKQELQVKRKVREENHAPGRHGYASNLPQVDASNRDYILTSEIEQRTGRNRPQVFHRLRKTGIHITALARLEKGVMGAYPRSKVEPYIEVWKIN